MYPFYFLFSLDVMRYKGVLIKKYVFNSNDIFPDNLGRGIREIILRLTLFAISRPRGKWENGREERQKDEIYKPLYMHER